MMLKLKLQHFGHLMVAKWADSFEGTLMLGRIEGRRRGGWQRMRWLGGITSSVDVGLGPRPTPGVGDGQGGLACCSSWGHRESDTTEQLNWLNWVTYLNSLCLNFLNKMWEIIGLTHRVLAGSNWVNMCEILSSWYLTCVLCGSISMTLFIINIIHSLIKYLLVPTSAVTWGIIIHHEERKQTTLVEPRQMQLK